MKVIHAASDALPSISPSSMAGGNTTADPDSSLTTMTGEGSVSVIPVSDVLDNTPLPKVPAPHDAVFRPDHRPASGNENAGRGDIWQDTDDKPLRGGGMWTEL